MKLIDFKESIFFKNIRKQMGISEDYKANFLKTEIKSKELQLIEIRTKGLDVSIEEIREAADGTLEHKDFPGEKMVVYIRDFIADYVRTGNIEDKYPKFHISWCKTLDDMYRKKRYNRYVVSQRNDGIFYLNKTINGNIVEKDIEANLTVCKYCLQRLNYKGYKSSIKQVEKTKIFNEFNLKDFLDTYNTSIIVTPEYTENNKPLNRYSDDWSKISYEMKKRNGFRCQDCGKDCSGDTTELHVHHIDGEKSNNRISNLEVVCIKCHSKKPMHSHMLDNPLYKKYLK